ncbi:MAG TPA: nitrate reductase cytochrome c-type subunit [Polyangiaceae bacterium]
MGAVGVVTAVVVGYLTGTRMPKREYGIDPVAEPPATDRAPSYAQMRKLRRGPNARMYENAFLGLRRKNPELFAAVVQSDADRERALEARRARRAYEGAPPTIPHSVAQLGTSACVGCHDKDVQIGGRHALRLPHANYANCMQCHVVDGDPVPGIKDDELPENSFVGLESQAGERAWPGAPPTIPHSTLMRTECGSCHGVAGRLGIRSTHPWRSSCQQCHAPSAALNQRTP